MTIRFHFPTEPVLPECYTALRCQDDAASDIEYRIELLTTPLRPMTKPVYQRGDATIYPTEKGWLRIYSALTAADGCQVACLLCPDGKNVLYYPASRWEYYRQYWHSNHLLGGEAVLLQHDAFLLHSSVVAVNGKTILFSGPSGAGKSTQAALWERFADAEILNGDRCVVMKKEDGFYGGGSPWSGTSGIYRSEQAPIAGIVLLKKGPENRLRRLGFEAFAPLFSQNSVAEVSLMGVVGEHIISGQIDRLVVCDDKVMIVDYKTNRPAAKNIDDVPSAYIKQMKSYKELVQQIYQNKKIEAYILWTNTADIMKLDNL
jgi:hypothetical protein